jgi:SNF2 family DNA or RNA helicase
MPRQMLTFRRRIEKPIRSQINRAMAMPASERKKAKATFFSMALRLRQAVSHPFTLFYMMRDSFSVQEIQEIRKEMRQVKRANPDRRFIEQVGSWCERQTDNGRIEGEVVQSRVPAQFGEGNLGVEFNMDPQLAKVEKLKSFGNGICHICSDPYRAPCRTKCKHVFCRDCIESVIETEKQAGSDIVACPTCDMEYGVNEMLIGQRSRRYKKNGALNPTMPGSDWCGLQPLGDEESAQFLEECDKNINLAMAPSAKTVMVKDIILKWQSKAPADKIIGKSCSLQLTRDAATDQYDETVFTQWVMVGRILGRMLQQENIKFVYFFGEMSRLEKENNIKVFHEVDEVKVMVSYSTFCSR